MNHEFDNVVYLATEGPEGLVERRVRRARRLELTLQREQRIFVWAALEGVWAVEISRLTGARRLVVSDGTVDAIFDRPTGFSQEGYESDLLRWVWRGLYARVDVRRTTPQDGLLRAELAYDEPPTR